MIEPPVIEAERPPVAQANLWRLRFEEDGSIGVLDAPEPAICVCHHQLQPHATLKGVCPDAH